MNINQYKHLLSPDKRLRDYQSTATQEIYDAWDEVDDVMFQMPTGTGKTVLFTSIIKDINDISVKTRIPVKILIVAHRKELIDQIDKKLKEYNVPHSKFVGSKSQRDSTPPVLVTSVQTISHPHNADERRALRDKVKFIIIDEAHHAVAKTYSRLWNCFHKAKILGVTATPYRLSHEGFTKLFDRLILSPSVKQFIKDGWLAPYSYYSLKSTSFVQSVIDGIDEYDAFGDYKESALENAMDKDKIRAQLVDSYLRFAKGRKGIVYSINRLHSEHICEKYASAGLRVAKIDSQTPQNERDSIVDNFKDGEIDILVNVNIFSEGFDCPDIEFIQLARPTTSLSMYLQQVGRGLRTTKGKTNCIILDNVGMYARFGLPDAKRMWKHHFIGQEIEEETNVKKAHEDNANKYWHDVDLTEGSEQMFLIQDVDGNIHSEDEYETPHDPTPAEYLAKIGFEAAGYIFWYEDINDTFEAYIQERGHYIVSKLEVDPETSEVHRIRIGRIPPDTWAFERFEKKHVNNLTIRHYEGSHTLFTWTFHNERDDSTVLKHYNYLGKEVYDPQEVEKRYIKSKKLGSDSAIDKIDLEVNRPSYFFKNLEDENKFVIKRKTSAGEKTIFKCDYHTSLGLFIDTYKCYEITRELENYAVFRYYVDNEVKIDRYNYAGEQVNTSGKIVPLQKTQLYKDKLSKQLGRTLSKELKPLLQQRQKEKEISIEEKIMKILSPYRGTMAKEIAEQLNIDKSEINRILYGRLKSEVRQDGVYKWYKK